MESRNGINKETKHDYKSGSSERSLVDHRRLLARPAFIFFERFGIHVTRVHYFSPVPDTRELRKDFHIWYREWTFTGVDFNLEEQLKLLQALQRDKLGYDKLPTYDEITSKGFGLGYGEIESHILHAMVRTLSPNP
jgi:hypothetical protein